VIAIPDDKSASDYVCPNDGNILVSITEAEFTAHLGGYTYLVEKLDSGGYRVVDREGSVVYTENDQNHAENAIQYALNALGSAGGIVQISEGVFKLSSGITLNDLVVLDGSGWGTVLDVSSLSQTTEAIVMAENSIVSRLKVCGVLNDNIGSSRGIKAANHSIIENIWLDRLAYGIETQDSQDVWIRCYKATDLRNEADWAACFHAKGTSSDITLTNFYWAGCNRGSEIEDGSSLITVENGYMEWIKQYRGGSVEPFAMDVHCHSSEVTCKYIRYRNIYGYVVYPPQTRGPEGTIEDVVFENIVLKSPLARLIITGERITLRNVTGFHLTRIQNAKHVLIENVKHRGAGNEPAWDILDNVDDLTIRKCVMEADSGFPDTGVRVNGSNTKNIKIVDSYFVSATFDAAVHIQAAGGKIYIENNFVPSGVPLVTGLTEYTRVKGNIGWLSDSFKAISQSVSVGISDAYGDPTTVASPSGIISSLKVCKIVIGGSFGAGENVTVKVETNWDSGNTAYVEKTYTATGTHYLDLDGQDGLDLWRDSDTCTSIKLYAKSDQASTSVTVTCDLAGAG